MDTVDRPTWTPWIWPAAIATLGVLLALSALMPGLGHWGMVALVCIILVALGLVGWAFVSARRQKRSFEARMEAWATERAVAQERMRIARDLHDLASHGLGLMTVRAATANLADDAERRTALADIERLGREASTQLRQMLTVLRRTDDEMPAPLSPTESLEDLPGIIDDARRTGLDIVFVSDDLADVPRVIQLTVCAVVREGLANTLRHAGPTTVQLSLQANDHAVVVDLHDHGPKDDWDPHPGAGHGLLGLRERIGAQGGTVTTGPAEGGFRLRAEIPLEEN